MTEVAEQLNDCHPTDFSRRRGPAEEFGADRLIGRLQLGVVGLHVAAACPLGRIHRRICTPEQLFGAQRRLVGVRDGQPDTGAHQQLVTAEDERLLEGLDHPVRDEVDGIDAALDQDGELVAAEPGHRVDRREWNSAAGCRHRPADRRPPDGPGCR